MLLLLLKSVEFDDDVLHCYYVLPVLSWDRM